MKNAFFMKTLKESMGNPGVKESSDGKAIIFNGEIAMDIIGSLICRPSKSTGSAWYFNIENQKIKHLDSLPNYFKKQSIEPQYDFTKTTELYDFTKTTELLESYQDKIKTSKHDLDYLKHDAFSKICERWSEKMEEASKSFKTSIIGTENYTTPYKCSNNSPMLSSLVNKSNH